MFIKEVIKAIDSLKLPKDDLRRVYFGNAMGLLKLKLPSKGKKKRN